MKYKISTFTRYWISAFSEKKSAKTSTLSLYLPSIGEIPSKGLKFMFFIVENKNTKVLFPVYLMKVMGWTKFTCSGVFW